MRKIEKTYCDPLSLVWLHAAAQMGMRIERSPEVNASWNGAGVLTIGTPETLDPDDSLAQMILHETCHALCEGPESIEKLDWGLENSGPAKRVHEHACLRLQAALADQHGLRAFFAATTMFRPYYDRLPADPLAAEKNGVHKNAVDKNGIDDESEAAAIAMAQAAWHRAKHGPWSAALNEALARTSQIARALRGATPADSLWHQQGGLD